MCQRQGESKGAWHRAAATVAPLIAFVGLLLLLAACGKSKEPLPDEYWTELEAWAQEVCSCPQTEQGRVDCAGPALANKPEPPDGRWFDSMTDEDVERYNALSAEAVDCSERR